ncbi:hypothetical protein [Nocardioides solisilvae]|uniref:iron-sulfur cluster-binding protein n=1 Tax=Nocardioides solisilvae TaxID=1542435 RepID=UPI00194F75F1|nr:hypothetical protein [Nocardioides solisilvae]
MPVHVVAEVLANRRAGAHRVLTLAAPGVAEGFRPGMFVAVTVGPAQLARRPMWVHRVRGSGTHGATLEVVVEPRGTGSRWLGDRAPGDRLPLTGPLGRAFALPREPVACLLVGEGVAAAPLLALAERLRERSCAVTMVVAADDEAHLLATLEARRLARAVTVVTADGSVGTRGRAEHVVADLVAGPVAGSAPAVVYASGSPALLRAVARAAEAHDVSAQVAVAPAMPCGTGLCGACEVPVQDAAGQPSWARACHEGPALRADRVNWGALADRRPGGGTGAARVAGADGVDW